MRSGDEIGPGSVVLAYDIPEAAWYEAVVHAALSDGFRLTWRDYPTYGPITRRRHELVDLHPRLAETRDWNDPACLSDFVWTRAHPKARRKLPNRFSRGSQFGYEDFAAFCSLSACLGRPVTHMARGHDHVEERFAIYPAYHAHPVLTTVALSRRLNRERFGSYERVPTVARVVEAALPQVYRLHISAEMIRDYYPEPDLGNGSDGETLGEAQT